MGERRQGVILKERSCCGGGNKGRKEREEGEVVVREHNNYSPFRQLLPIFHYPFIEGVLMIPQQSECTSSKKWFGSGANSLGNGVPMCLPLKASLTSRIQGERPKFYAHYPGMKPLSCFGHSKPKVLMPKSPSFLHWREISKGRQLPLH